MAEEIKLHNTRDERNYYDSLADLYSIFVATEMLEKAFIRSSVSAGEYDVSVSFMNYPLPLWYHVHV